MTKPIVAITAGDAAGIGPEILAGALFDFLKKDLDFNLLAVCDARVLEMGCRITGIDLPVRQVTHPDQAGREPSAVDIFDTGTLDAGRITPGTINHECGRAMVEDTSLACRFYTEGVVHAVVGGPHSKKAAQAAGFDFEGYPHFIRDLTGVEHTYFLLVLNDFRVTAVTHHIALKDVSRNVTKASVLHAIQTLNRSVKEAGISVPRLVVSGLNPHCGEGGLFGDEEITAIGPAVENARNMGIEVEGPFAADSLFFGIPEKIKWDAYLVMYHDQSHLPLKTVAFDRGCAQVLGSPVLFFTVCHGLALDLSGRGIARHSSLKEAISLAGLCAGLAKPSQ